MSPGRSIWRGSGSPCCSHGWVFNGFKKRVLSWTTQEWTCRADGYPDRVSSVTHVTSGGTRSTPCDGHQFTATAAYVVREIAAEGHDPVLSISGRAAQLRRATRARRSVVRATGHRAAHHLHWTTFKDCPSSRRSPGAVARLRSMARYRKQGALADVFRGVMSPPYFRSRPMQLLGDVRSKGWGRRLRGRRARCAPVGPAHRSDLGFRSRSKLVRRLPLRSRAGHRPRRPWTDFTPPSSSSATGSTAHHDAAAHRGGVQGEAPLGHCTIDYAVHVAAKQALARWCCSTLSNPWRRSSRYDSARRADRSASIGGPKRFVASSDGLRLTLVHQRATDQRSALPEQFGDGNRPRRCW